MNYDVQKIESRAKTPRAAAIAGILFSLLLITGMVLVRISVPSDPQDAGEWLPVNAQRVSLALNLVPFAGIAFLWFMGVVRDRLGSSEDRFIATVFLGSGLLFLATLFAAAAIAGATISLSAARAGTLLGTDVYAFGRSLTYEIMNVYAMKMAGVFMLTTCTLALRTGILPRWMAFLGMALALILLLTLGFLSWAPLLFPLWILLISVHILLANLRRTGDGPSGSVVQ